MPIPQTDERLIVVSPSQTGGDFGSFPENLAYLYCAIAKIHITEYGAVWVLVLHPQVEHQIQSH